LGNPKKAVLFCGLALFMGGCAQDRGATVAAPTTAQGETSALTREARLERGSGTSLRSLFGGGDNPNTTVEVNKYLWTAALDILSFLPIESVDPFTGVIVTGFGRPPGGGRAYRATIYVQDPALDARSLRVALQGPGGAPVSAETQRAVEDAILTRARQLRIQDSNL
jgi:hypothetical protein